WIDEEAIRQWKQSKQDKRGRPRQFSDLAIQGNRMKIVDI
ncbi:hypothetical protein CRN62_14535, partial [Vibrio vulnificus]